MTAGYQDANSNFSGMNEWLEHFHNLPFAWMRLLGVQSLPNTKFASKEAMAAVGGNAPVVSLLINFFTGLSIGANVIIARNIGAKNPDKARKAVSQL